MLQEEKRTTSLSPFWGRLMKPTLKAEGDYPLRNLATALSNTLMNWSTSASPIDVEKQASPSLEMMTPSWSRFRCNRFHQAAGTGNTGRRIRRAPVCRSGRVADLDIVIIPKVLRPLVITMDRASRTTVIV